MWRNALQQICHRDLKLENTLLDGSPAPRLKICDFGYSKVFEFENFICSFQVDMFFLSYFLCTNVVVLSISSVVIFVAFKTKINCWNSSIHSTRGSISTRVWWKGAYAHLWLTAIRLWKMKTNIISYLLQNLLHIFFPNFFVLLQEMHSGCRNTFWTRTTS